MSRLSCQIFVHVIADRKKPNENRLGYIHIILNTKVNYQLASCINANLTDLDRVGISRSNITKDYTRVLAVPTGWSQ